MAESVARTPLPNCEAALPHDAEAEASVAKKISGLSAGFTVWKGCTSNRLGHGMVLLNNVLASTLDLLAVKNPCRKFSRMLKPDNLLCAGQSRKKSRLQCALKIRCNFVSLASYFT